jgi:hypothetical protein
MSARPTLALRLGAALWTAMLAGAVAGILLPHPPLLPSAILVALLFPAALLLAGLLLRPLRAQVATLARGLDRLGTGGPEPELPVLPELREMAAALPRAERRTADDLRAAEARRERLQAVLNGMPGGFWSWTARAGCGA